MAMYVWAKRGLILNILFLFLSLAGISMQLVHEQEDKLLADANLSSTKY